MEYQFPRTPHLSGSSVVDDDRTMPTEQAAELCRTCEVVLQEKLDGTLVGVFFDESGQPVCQKRAGLLTVREKPQYNVFRNWVRERRDQLWEILSTRWVMFGEFLWQTHAIFYDRLPDLFVAFDLFDREANSFAGSKLVVRTLSGLVTVVPELWRGQTHNFRDLMARIQPHLSKSAFGQSPEGVYVRFEQGQSLIARAKYRKSGFQPGWNAKHPERNRVLGGH
jgi:hypothetical protein